MSCKPVRFANTKTLMFLSGWLVQVCLVFKARCLDLKLSLDTVARWWTEGSVICLQNAVQGHSQSIEAVREATFVEATLYNEHYGLIDSLVHVFKFILRGSL